MVQGDPINMDTKECKKHIKLLQMQLSGKKQKRTSFIQCKKAQVKQKYQIMQYTIL